MIKGGLSWMVAYSTTSLGPGMMVCDPGTSCKAKVFNSM